MATGAVGLFALAVLAKDPVVMTVNGDDVTLSEFEYLYNKNSEQQLNPQPLDEYVEMFKVYKLKVADAKASGIDTLPTFRKEMAQYKHDLALPYLTDSVYINQLYDESYNNGADELEVSHIMIFKNRGERSNTASRAMADSILEVLKGGADFSEVARMASQDRPTANRGGRMGYITVDQYPYSFEKAAYALKEGEISDVVESPFGYHIIKAGKRRPNRGKVLVSHILKVSPDGAPADRAEKARNFIDSVYNLVMADPDKFASIAETSSDDRNSARQGGALPWFGTGEMVEDFDSVSFALKDGEISKPFKSSFGWHIVKRIDHRDRASKAEGKSAFLTKLANPNDERNALIRDHQTERLAAKHKGSLNAATIAAIREDIKKHGIDSAYFQNWTSGPLAGSPLATVGKKTYTVGDMYKKVRNVRQPDPESAERLFDHNLKVWYNGLVVEAEQDELAQTEPDYRNLLKEYEEGSMLYEVSVQKVWDRAAKDSEGLENYFQAHRGDYTWKSPQAKGFLVQAVNESVANLIKAKAATLGRDTLVSTLRKEFGKEMHLERVLVPQGVNAMVDYLMFNGPKAEPISPTYTVLFMLDGRILNAPEEVSDVRGQVTSDYQNEFEKQWIEELKAKYPVTVNTKVLKKVKNRK